MKHHFVFVGAAFLAACQSPAPQGPSDPDPLRMQQVGQEAIAQFLRASHLESTLLAVASDPVRYEKASPGLSKKDIIALIDARMARASGDPSTSPSVAATNLAEASTVPTVSSKLPQALVTNIILNYERQIEVALYNIANYSTAGFKKKILQFEATPKQTTTSAHAAFTQGEAKRYSDTQINIEGYRTLTATDTTDNVGSRIASIVSVFSQGTLEMTSRNLDIAITGDGLFQVTNSTGELGYTRSGQFHVNRDGKLVTAKGYLLTPEIKLANDVIEINIDQAGRITGRCAGSPDTTTHFGQIQLARFVDPSNLQQQEGSFWIQTDASGSPTFATPNTDGMGTTKQGFVERSNVEIFHELINLRLARQNQHRFMKSIGLE